VITIENAFSGDGMMKEKTIGSNVAVVGGGLAGLTAANFLARAGFSVTQSCPTCKLLKAVGLQQ
jgi:NADPH-dependent glutamate synthase beta subunit-like oxidoreductase